MLQQESKYVTGNAATIPEDAHAGRPLLGDYTGRNGGAPQADLALLTPVVAVLESL